MAWLAAGQSHALTLKEAVDTALHSNPEIGQAIENREAIEFELRQARGLYLAFRRSRGLRRIRLLDNTSRRILDLDDDELNRAEVGVVVTQKLIDFGSRRAEVDRQASRVDGASFRVLERSQVIALAVVQDYLEYLLQARIVADTAQNVQFHQGMAGGDPRGRRGRRADDADRQQAEERLLAAKSRNVEASGELEEAKIRFFKTVGVPSAKPCDARVGGRFAARVARFGHRSGSRQQPARQGRAELTSIQRRPTCRAARSRYYPELFAEGSARAGTDVDGDEGNTNDLQARLVLRWNLYRGGIDKANEQEKISRASEQRLVLHQVAPRDRRSRATRPGIAASGAPSLPSCCEPSRQSNDTLVSSYREQFKVGQRSLLDVLDAQNTRFNTKILADTATFASLFAEYRILATTGELVGVMGLSAPEQADAYARAEFNVPSAPEADDYARTPSHQENNFRSTCWPRSGRRSKMSVIDRPARGL